MINVFSRFSFLFFLTQGALCPHLFFRKSFNTTAFLKRVRQGAGEMIGTHGNGECGSLTIFLSTSQGENFERGIYLYQILTRGPAWMSCPYQLCSGKILPTSIDGVTHSSTIDKCFFHIQSDCSADIEQGFGRRGYQCLKNTTEGEKSTLEPF